MVVLIVTFVVSAKLVCVMDWGVMDRGVMDSLVVDWGVMDRDNLVVDDWLVVNRHLVVDWNVVNRDDLVVNRHLVVDNRLMVDYGNDVGNDVLLVVRCGYVMEGSVVVDGSFEVSLSFVMNGSLMEVLDTMSV